MWAAGFLWEVKTQIVEEKIEAQEILNENAEEECSSELGFAEQHFLRCWFSESESESESVLVGGEEGIYAGFVAGFEESETEESETESESESETVVGFDQDVD